MNLRITLWKEERPKTKDPIIQILKDQMSPEIHRINKVIKNMKQEDAHKMIHLLRVLKLKKGSKL